MRIALVSEHADPLAALGSEDAGGQNVHVAALASGLTKLGHDVVVHTRRSDLVSPTRERCRDGYVVDRVQAGPCTDVPKDALLPHMTAFGDALRSRWAVEPADLVHAHFWMSGLAALRACAGTAVPLVQTFHALGSVKRREQGLADTSPAARLGLERRLCREVDHVIATCSDEVEELHDLGLRHGRATVIPCGVDVETFRPARAPRPPGPPRVLVVGRLVARKGVAEALEAAARLPGVEVVVAGGPAPGNADAMATDPDLGRLRDLAERLAITDRVRFTGGVAREEVAGLMRTSDAVVTVPWYEPFGIVPLEAMASGVPVVGSAVGGLLDTVVPGETGELVAPRDPQGLGEVLGALLADPARCRRYGAAGRRRAVAQYDWQRIAERTDAAYREILGAARPKVEATTS